MDPIVKAVLYLFGGGMIGVVAAWAVRNVAGTVSGFGWHADGWPRGIQEEEPISDWGQRIRAPAAQPRTAPGAALEGTIEEIPAGQAPAVPVHHVRR